MIRLTILLATITIAAALATPAYAEQQWCVMTCAKGVPRGTENEEASKSKNARCIGVCAAEREACEDE
jgi:hypothetical protein